MTNNKPTYLPIIHKRKPPMHKQSPEYQAKLQNTHADLCNYEHVILEKAKKTQGNGGLLRIADMARHAQSFLKDLQSLTYGSAEKRALGALTPKQHKILNDLIRILPNGKHINLVNPTDEQLNLPIIIKNLANLTLFGGSAQHIDFEKYTVAHHLLLGVFIINNTQIAAGMTAHERKLFIMYWLAHDMQEGSLGFDLISPAKSLAKLLAGWDIFKFIEDAHSKPIHLKLGLQWPVPNDIAEKVKQLDAICLSSEALYLLDNGACWPDARPAIAPHLFDIFITELRSPRDYETMLANCCQNMFGSEVFPTSEPGKRYRALELAGENA